MKALKKLSCVLLAVLLLMSLSVNAFAASGSGATGDYGVENKGENNTHKDEGDFTITIESEVSGHTYEAYQIFKGDIYTEYNEDGTIKSQTLSNIEWGDNIDPSKMPATERDAEAVAKKLSEENIEQYAEWFDEALKGDPAGYTSTHNGSAYLIEHLHGGYYLVKDKNGSGDGQTDFAYTRFILEVLGPSSAKPKGSVPSVEKEVMDTNDSQYVENNGAYGESADYDIGDHVHYRQIATLPSTYHDYETYILNFHDKMDNGLSFVADSVHAYKATKNAEGKIVLGDEIAKTYYSVVTADLDDGCSFEVRFADTKTIEGLGDESIIVLTYTAELTADAAYKVENDVYLEYSNNPNHEGDGTPPTGTTPPDTAVVFTYTTIVNKVDGDAKPVAGAEFELSKWDSATKSWIASQKYTLSATDEISNVFTFKGLDDGIYRLVETVVPAGYNRCDDIFFTVEATHNSEGATLTVKAVEVSMNTEGQAEAKDLPAGEDGLELTFTLAGDGAVSTNVVNQQGLILPETGGIGTTIFYVVGGLLIAAALVLLITKKRMTKEG